MLASLLPNTRIPLQHIHTHTSLSICHFSFSPLLHTQGSTVARHTTATPSQLDDELFGIITASATTGNVAEAQDDLDVAAYIAAQSAQSSKGLFD